MVDWVKKIKKSVGGDIAADEQVEAAMFVQPAGTTNGMMSRQIGGIVGAAIAGTGASVNGESAKLSRDTGFAAEVEERPLVLGLTGRRLLMWSHSTMSGKPKELRTAIPLNRVAAVEMEKGKLSTAVVIAFDDGSGVTLEAPKMQKPEEFLQAFRRLTGR